MLSRKLIHRGAILSSRWLVVAILALHVRDEHEDPMDRRLERNGNRSYRRCSAKRDCCCA